jgi:hypothetical protein
MIFSASNAPIGGVQFFWDTRNNEALPLYLASLELLFEIVVMWRFRVWGHFEL